MDSHVNRLAAAWLLPLLSAASLAWAAGPDLRLITAAAEQDKVALRALIKQGVDVNTTRADGATALLYAAHRDDLDVVDLLLKAGANVNAAEDHGVNPLARAVENASVAMVERLLKAGANPNAAQTSGLTPLMTAAHTGSLQVVKALLGHGANVNAATETKHTALMWAVADRHADIARVLVEGQANVHASTDKGFTPLMFAARNGNIEMAKILIAAGVGVNEAGADGTHVLPFSVVYGQSDFALFLLDQGADPNSEIGGVRALHAAAGAVHLWLREWTQRHGAGDGLGFGVTLGRPLASGARLALVKALLAKGADANPRTTTSTMLMGYIGYPKKGAFEPFACGTGDLRGATPLWVAAYTANGSGYAGDQTALRTGRNESSGEVIRALLAGGADYRLTTDDGTTPLMVAAGLGRSTFEPGLQRGNRSTAAEEAVTILLDGGADIHAVNEADFTAIHGAAFRGLNEVIQILVDRGANINVRDFRGRTPYRLAEGSKQSFQFQAYPETAAFIKKLGANTTIGIPGTVHERLRDVPAADAQQQQ
jgi:ankyrin repeat protein